MEDIGVAFFTYCRPEHTRKALEGLSANKFKCIYIFQDGLKNAEDTDAWNEVSQIIKHSGLSQVEVHISHMNKGLAQSVISGINYVMERHEAVVALEDDVVLGRGYDRFMKECLEKYRDNKSVACVAGGGWPIDVPVDYGYDVFYSYRASSIAWGTWRDRWKYYKRDFAYFKEILSDKEKRTIYKMSGNDIKTVLEAQICGKCDSWALFWVLMQINMKAVCVLPVRYLARDIGHDGVHGTNSTKRISRYDTELFCLDENHPLQLPDAVVVNESIISQINRIISIGDLENIERSTKRLYGKWIDALHRGEKPIVSYLKAKGIHTVYIYGAGQTARKLIQEIDGYIVIKGVIVLDKEMEMLCGFPVYDFHDKVELEKSCILLTPVYDMEYIEYSLGKRFGTNMLINIEEIFDCWLN